MAKTAPCSHRRDTGLLSLRAKLLEIWVGDCDCVCVADKAAGGGGGMGGTLQLTDVPFACSHTTRKFSNGFKHRIISANRERFGSKPCNKLYSHMHKRDDHLLHLQLLGLLRHHSSATKMNRSLQILFVQPTNLKG